MSRKIVTQGNDYRREIFCSRNVGRNFRQSLIELPAPDQKCQLLTIESEGGRYIIRWYLDALEESSCRIKITFRKVRRRLLRSDFEISRRNRQSVIEHCAGFVESAGATIASAQVYPDVFI